MGEARDLLSIEIPSMTPRRGDNGVNDRETMRKVGPWVVFGLVLTYWNLPGLCAYRRYPLWSRCSELSQRNLAIDDGVTMGSTTGRRRGKCAPKLCSGWCLPTVICQGRVYSGELLSGVDVASCRNVILRRACGRDNALDSGRCASDRGDGAEPRLGGALGVFVVETVGKWEVAPLPSVYYRGQGGQDFWETIGRGQGSGTARRASARNFRHNTSRWRRGAKAKRGAETSSHLQHSRNSL